MQIRHLWAAAVLVLGACASHPPSAPGTVAPAGRLAAEQQSLEGLFRGTPVVFTMQPDGRMRVTVPMRYSFDRGRYAVKPPLGAVLEHIARRERGESTRFDVAAPGDPGGRGSRLAHERARSVRDYLVGTGVAATRFTLSTLTSGDEVVVVVGSDSPM